MNYEKMKMLFAKHDYEHLCLYYMNYENICWLLNYEKN